MTRLFGYGAPAALVEDLRVLERSLAANAGAHAGLVQVRALVRQVQVFGFHLAKLDVRVPAAWVARRRARRSPRRGRGMRALAEADRGRCTAATTAGRAPRRSS